MKTWKKYWLMVLLLLSIVCPVSAQVSVDVITNRISGNAPLAVNFDASATTAVGVTKPFHDLNYTWDFGDPGAGTWDLTTGKDKNKTTGPFVAHVYDEPGTYTATLTVSDFNGHTSTHTVNITVSQFSNTICFSASGDFSGAPAGAQTVTTSNFNEALGYASENTRLLFRSGETFTSSSTAGLNVGNTMIGAFGSGSKPKVVASHGNRLIDVSASDVRVVGLHFECSQQNDLLSPSGWMKNLLFYKNYTTPGRFHSGISFAGSAAAYWNHDLWEDIFFVENELKDFGFGSGGNIMFFSIDKAIVMGNHLEDAVGGEHVIRAEQIQKGIISNNILSNSRNQKHPLTIRALDNSESYHIVVSDNIIESPDDWAIQAVAKNNDLHTVYGHDLIFERNYITQIHGRAGVQVGIHLSYASDVTVRNNICNMDGWEGHTCVDVVPNTFVYNNTAYTSDASNIRLVDGGATLINNLVYVPNGSVTWNGGTTSNNIEASTNPFVATTFNGPEDFELNSTSQAINAGTDVLVKYDFKGADRPVSGVYDAGAYEYGGVIADYLNVSPDSLYFVSTGGSQDVTLSSNTTWTASDDQPWISLTPASGSNNGTITITVDEFTQTGTRTGGITVTDGSIVKNIDVVQEGYVAVSGITVVPESANVGLGNSTILTTTFSPANASDQGVSWSSNNTAIATVDANGQVTGVAEGVTTVKVVTDDGSYTDSCEITVIDADPDFIGYWSFDEVSGSTAYDGSGNNNDGTLKGNASFVSGRVNNAVSLDGTNSWVDIPDQVFTGDFTIAAWVKLSGTIDNEDALCGQEGSGQDINFYGQKLRLYTGSSDAIVANTSISSENWVHYTVTRSGSLLTLYVNGQVDKTGSLSDDFIPKALGRGNNGVGTEGLLDEVYLYSRELSPSEIEALYDAAPSIPVTATLVWEDDYDGTNWIDGNNDGVNEWHSYNENTSGADWSVISKTQAQSEGVDVSEVTGDKLYKGVITATNASSHRAYPLTHLDDEGYGQQPGFAEGVPSPMVNQWDVWWDPENIDLEGKWMHFGTWSNNPDWNVNTLTVIDGGAEPYILDIVGGDKIKEVQYHANRAVPTKQWIRFTVYIDYGYDNGGGSDNDGIMAVWMNGTLIATGTGNHLDPDNFPTGSTYLKRAHWGLYASGNCDRGKWYEDVNKIWTLSNPLTNFDSEPMAPGTSPVTITGVTLDQTSLTLDEGQTAQLTEMVSPSNASDKSVSWSSSNPAVATVDANGLVSAVTPGSATITVTTTDGGYTADCALTVYDNTPVSLTGVNLEYRNPFSANELTLVFTGFTNAMVTIVDIRGKIILKKQVDQDELKLSKSKFSEGVYLIRIISGGKVYNKKFIVK